MQKRTSKRWPFRKDADPREDPLHPETTFLSHPEREFGAKSFTGTIFKVALKAGMNRR